MNLSSAELLFHKIRNFRHSCLNLMAMGGGLPSPFRGGAGGGVMRIESVVGRVLKEKKATLAVAESCTGGLISHLLTQVPGSSDYFLFGAITYSNASKMKVLGVLPETLKNYGAVHEQTAKEMAEGVRQLAGSTYAISTSGIAGPDGGTPEKPVGTVCIGIATPQSSQGYRFCFPSDTREANKRVFAIAALELLYKELSAYP